MAQAAQILADEQIVASIRDVSGQVAVGSHIDQKMLKIGSMYGGVINMVPPGQQPHVRPRTIPVMLRPRPFPGLLDRQPEVSAAVGAFQLAAPIEFYGQAGLGKTSLLRYLAYVPTATSYPDGIVYLRVRNQALGDVLQAIYDVFYESDVPFKPTDTQIQLDLKGKRALVLLDDEDLTRDEAGALLNGAPNCSFILTSIERRLWGEGRAAALTGLPPDDALALIERELGRPLIPAERPTAQSLCAALAGHPLHLIQAAALVREEGRSLAEIAHRMQTASPNEALKAEIVTERSEAERRVLSVLAALGDATLSAESVAAVAGITDVTPVLDSLQQRGLVQEERRRYSVAGTLGQALRQVWNLTPWAEELLVYFMAWAEQRRNTPNQMREELESILEVLKWATEAGHWAEVVRVGRAVEGALALCGWWDAWAKVLRWVLRAAQTLGDRTGEAWALHQLGTRSLCLGDTTTARESLNQALALREASRDRIGSAVTRHNLTFLPPIPPVQHEQHEDGRPRIHDVLHRLAFTLLPVLLVALGAGATWLIAREIVGASPATGFSSSSLDFGAQQVGSSSPEQTVRVTNNRRGDLVIRRVTLAGVTPTDFHITADACTGRHIASTRSCTLRVNFAPSATGDRRATLIVTSNASDSPRDLPLSGRGVGVPGVGLSPSNLNFDSVTVGQDLVKTISLTDTGTGDLTVTSIAPAGAQADDFHVINSCSGSIAPHKSCAISVRFAPTAAGSRIGTLTVTDNAAGSPQSAPLTGTGIGVPNSSLKPSRLDFGSVTVGVTSPPQTITLTNIGTGDLSVSQVSFGPASQGDTSFTDFNVTSDTCIERRVAPGQGCTIRVSLTPSALGNRAGAVTITDNAAGSPRRVTLSGTGIPVQLVSIAVTPANPSVPVGTNLKLTATGTYSDSSQKDLSNSATWSADSKEAATVVAGGLITGNVQGTSTISATLDGVSGQTTVTVTPPILVSIAVTPANSCINVNATQQFTAMGMYSDGQKADITNRVEWSSSNTQAATITRHGGLATAGLNSSTNLCNSPNVADTTVITAASGAVSGSANLTVQQQVIQ